MYTRTTSVFSGSVLLGIVVWLVLAPVHAHPPLDDAPQVSIRQARLDADDDFVPDRLGDTLTVAGRATVGSGVLYPNRLHVFIQADSAGILLYAPAIQAPVQPGDSVVATGVIDQYNGLTQLRTHAYRVVDAPPRRPAPQAMSIAEARRETNEGRLARIRGRVINRGTNRGGHYLVLIDTDGGDDLLTVFVENTRLNDIPLAGYEIGDDIVVTGPLAQYDFEAPYDGYRQIIPRSGADIRAVGLTNRFYRRAALIGVLLLLVAVCATIGLRIQVRRRTQQLAKSRARFRRLSEATSEGIVVHANRRIVDVNQALLELTGYARDELIDEDVLDFLAPPSRETARAVIQDEEERTYEVTILRKDGSSFPAEVEAKNLHLDGQSVRIVAVRDITEQKQHEAELLAAKEQAEEVARLKTSLLNNMSHELRTPMTSIIGYAELILNGPPEEHKTFAKHIRQSGLRLTDTLNSVLEMAQIEAGTLTPHLEPVDVAATVHEVVDLVRPTAAAKSIEVRVDLADAASLYTDQRFLYRILSNLLSNAIKFTDEEGTVCVETTATEHGVRLRVRDTGVGIDPDFLPHLFDAFHQESQGLCRHYEGTGLGLAITKRMVDLLDGTIEVTSEKGVGTTFTIALPDLAPTPTPDHAASPPANRSTPS